MTPHRRDLDKIMGKHEAFEETKPKSYYPGGHAKTVFVASRAFCDGWDRIFGAKEPDDFDVPSNATARGTKR